MSGRWATPQYRRDVLSISWQSVRAYSQSLGEAIDREQATLPEAGREYLSKARERAATLNLLLACMSRLAGGKELDSNEEIP